MSSLAGAFSSFILALIAMSAKLSLLSLVAALTPAALAGVHEALDAVPSGWTSVHASMKAADSQLSTFTIALSIPNLNNLESMLTAVATPGNAKYGQFLDDNAISSTFAPAAGAVDDVTSWLRDSGVAHYKVDGSFIDFAADIPTVNKLLSANYQYYKNGDSTKLRTLQYSIPDHIQQHVEMVDPATFFGTPTAFKKVNKKISLGRRDTAPAASCAQALSPSCVKALYNVGDYKADARSGSRVGFSSFLNQSALYSDAFVYENAFGIPGQNFSVVTIAGGVNDQDPKTAQTGEANMDVQNIIGVSHPLPITEFITGGSP